MISQTAEYALRAIVWLAGQGAEPVTRQALARATKVPPDYLSKVMQSLSRHRLVKAQRGKNGGFSLVKSSEKLTVLEVVNAVDQVQRIKKCPLGLKSHDKRLCALHQRMDDTMVMVERVFGQTTIAELMQTRGGPKPLCHIAGLGCA